MQALVLKAPGHVAVEHRPRPKLQADTDVIIRVSLAGLCGSDVCPAPQSGRRLISPSGIAAARLSRQLQVCQSSCSSSRVPPLTLGPGWRATTLLWRVGSCQGEATTHLLEQGHEGVGTIVEAGAAIKHFKVGDFVVSPFTISCGDCFYCRQGATSRCDQNALFGSLALDGMQAEYARVPLADATLFAAPRDMPQEVLLLMADIFCTGFHAAQSAVTMLGADVARAGTAVVLGCGPVGLCAVTAAAHFFGTVLAYDHHEERLRMATAHGATTLIPNADDAERLVQEATKGRGADAVLEIVGAEDALHMAIKLARPWGVVSCVGIHTHPVTLDGQVLYNKVRRPPSRTSCG